MKMIVTTVILVKQNMSLPNNNLLLTHTGRYLITSIVKTFSNYFKNCFLVQKNIRIKLKTIISYLFL